MRSCGRAREGVGCATGRRGGRGGRPPAPRQTPPEAKPQPKPPHPPSKKRRFSFESGLESDDAASARASQKPPAPTPPHGLRRPSPPPKGTNPPKTATPPPPPTPKTDTPKVGGATTEKKDDRPDDLIVETVAHVPYSTRVEKGTVCSVHGRKGGAEWVQNPGGTALYEVARHVLFPTREEAERYREKAQAGKSPNPRPHKRRD